MNRLFLINKKSGVTSFQTVAQVRRKLKIKKAGHAGTLDQFASGLLLILTGRYTRLVEYFTDFDKVYRGTFEFGVETDTLDPEGEIICRSSVPTLNEIESVLPSFLGKIYQQPPQYSAVHINGERAYRLALQGKNPEMPVREVEIYDMKILSYNPPFLDVEVHCSKGTYIRSLARDLAKACGTCGYVKSLQRSAVSHFPLQNSITIDELKEDGSDGLKDRELFKILPQFPQIELKELFLTSFLCGKPLKNSWFEGDLSMGISAVFQKERFLGIIEKKGEDFIQYRFVLGDHENY